MRIDVAQLEFIDSNLRKLLVWIEEKTGIEFTITSLYRVDDSGVHGQIPLRGTDLRLRNRSVGIEIEYMINQQWRYDPKRPQKVCALLHGNENNLHLHLQVHPNTVMKGNG